MKKRTICIVLTVLLCSMFCFAGCSSKQNSGEKLEATKEATAYPLTLTDDLGKSVTFDKEPAKAVSLSPSNTEIICGVNAVDKLVGRTDYCDFPAEVSKVKSIGDYSAPSTEAIIALSPDVVFAAEYIDDNVRSQLESAGIGVFVLKATDIDAVEQDILKVAKILNKNADAADTIENMEAERSALVEACKKADAPKSVFIDLGDFYTSGDGSLQDAMLKEINAENIAAGTGKNVLQMSAEQIIKADPDVYISLFPTVEEIKKTAGFDALKAVKNNMVVALDMMSTEATVMQRPGPRVIAGMKELAKIIYPEIIQ